MRLEDSYVLFGVLILACMICSIGCDINPPDAGRGTDKADLKESQKNIGDIQRPEYKNFLVLDNGIVRDNRTGLEWIVGPDTDTNWEQAMQWVKDINFDGAGWRLPRINELSSLYFPNSGKRNMTPLLKTTGWWVWSDESEGRDKVKYFDFYNRTWGLQKKTFARTVRAFAVRSSGEK